MSDNDWRNGMLLWSVVLASAACAPANDQVGSVCTGGVCTGALTTKGPVCLASEPIAEFGEGEIDPSNTLCLPAPIHKAEDGKLSCNVSFTLAANTRGGGPARCPELPFVRPAAHNTCIVDQIAPPSQATSSDEGWYYDESDTGTCEGPAALHFTERAIIREGSTMIFTCRSSLGLTATGDLEPIDIDECTLPADSARHANTVGDPCHPPVPEGGFRESESYVATGVSECSTGACLVFHLRGDPSASCEAGDAGTTVCATPDDVAHRVYCSCRCDAEPGEPDACDCPDHFTCARAFDDLSPGLDGSYCVYTGTGNAR